MMDIFPHPYTKNDAEFWVDYNQSVPARYLMFAIVSPEGRNIGSIGITPEQVVNKKSFVTIGYMLSETEWGKGIMPEAVSMLTNYIFSNTFTELVNTIPVMRIESTVYAFNKASGRVLEKAGFVLEAVQKNKYWKEEQYVDGILYVKQK